MNVDNLKDIEIVVSNKEEMQLWLDPVAFEMALEAYGLFFVSNFNEDSVRYIENIETDEELGKYIIENDEFYQFNCEGKEYLKNFFDFEAFGKEHRHQFEGYFVSKGYVEIID